VSAHHQTAPAWENSIYVEWHEFGYVATVHDPVHHRDIKTSHHAGPKSAALAARDLVHKGKRIRFVRSGLYQVIT
jgi:hypothetical protein